MNASVSLSSRLLSLRGYRLGFLIVIAVLVAFGAFVDPVIGGEYLGSIYAIRFGFMVPMLLACYISSFVVFFRPHHSLVGTVAALSVNIGVVLIIYINGQSSSAVLYTQSLPMVIGFAPALMQLKHRHSIALILVTFGVYNGVCFYSTPRVLLEKTDAFMAACGIIGVYIRLITVRLLRENSYKAELLLEERNKLRLSQSELSKQLSINSRILSIISHDLKAPLTSLKGLVDIYCLGVLSTKELEEHMMRIKALMDTTKSLLDNILHWSMLYIDGKVVARSNFDLHDAVMRLVELYNPIVAAKNNTLVNAVTGSTMVNSDPGIVDLILRNLISNSNKFTENGTIIVCAVFVSNGVEVSVEDTGIGMDAWQVEKLLTWDGRQSEPGTRQEKGTGIGLMICRDFLKQQGGTLQCVSQKGVGTKFSFVVPSVANAVHESVIQKIKGINVPVHLNPSVDPPQVNI